MKKRKILINPLYTEKMASLQESENKYAFRVNPTANKIEIKRAIEDKFEVKIKSVRTLNVRGKRKQQLTRAGRFEGRRANWKKAIITLEEGYQIDLFTNA